MPLKKIPYLSNASNYQIINLRLPESYSMAFFNRFVKNIPMNQTQVKQIILDHLKAYQPVSIGIFGSFARGENTGKSDIDILVKFKVTPSLLTLIRIENELSEHLGIKVDLITTGSIKNKRIKKSIEKDLVNIL